MVNLNASPAEHNPKFEQGQTQTEQLFAFIDVSERFDVAMQSTVTHFTEMWQRLIDDNPPPKRVLELAIRDLGPEIINTFVEHLALGTFYGVDPGCDLIARFSSWTLEFSKIANAAEESDGK